jgi:protease-4
MRKLIALLSPLLLAGCIYVNVPLHPGVKGVEEKVVEGSGRAKVVIVDISGILSLGKFGLQRFSKEPPLIPRMKEELQAAKRDENVVALVVRINSPGGSVTASDILYHELKTFGEKKKVPVVACIMDEGLSGGYYASLAAREIVAHPTSVVGAVGVISWRIDIEGLLKKWGIETETVKSGPWKDFWSPLREARPGEIKLMQGIVDSMQQRYLKLLKENRKLSPEALQQVATGKVFDAPKARELGLVDDIGYLDDAIDKAKKLAGVSEAKVILYRRPGTYAEDIYAAGSPLLRGLSLIEEETGGLLTPSLRYQAGP